VVHAGNRHLRNVPGRIRRIDSPGREEQAIEDSPLIGIDAGNFVAGKILEGHRQVGWGKLLAELRRERIEFGSEVVGDGAGEMAGDVRRGEDIELRQGRHLVREASLPCGRTRARRARERRILRRPHEQAHPVGNDACGSHAGPESFNAAGVAFVARQAEVRGLDQTTRVALVVEGVDRGLVRHDEDVAQTGELLRDRRDIDVAEQEVLVFFFDQLIADGKTTSTTYLPAGNIGVLSSGFATQIVQFEPGRDPGVPLTDPAPVGAPVSGSLPMMLGNLYIPS